MTERPVEIVVMPERPLARDDEPSEFDIAVEIRCRASESDGRSDSAMNLCLVIDRSGSMQGPKLEAAKRSCIDIFRRLSPADLLSVVTFDHTAEVVINPQTPRDEVEEKISGVATGGSTNLSDGWYQGLLELQTHMTPAHHSRLFLLSDGHANAGITKRSNLVTVAAKSHELGITTSSIGIGEDFDEDLLEAIATASGGRFWYIGESGIEDILETEFRGALTVLIDRPRLRLDLPAGVTIRKEMNSLKKISGRYWTRPLQGEDTVNFAVRLAIEPEAVQGDAFTIGATLYDAEESLGATKMTISLAPIQTVVEGGYHPLVRSIVQQHETSVSDEQKLDALESGDLSTFKQMLSTELDELRRMRDEMNRLAAEENAERFVGWDSDRVYLEQDHLGVDGEFRGAALLIVEMFQPYADNLLVQNFVQSSLRKGLHQKRHHWAARDFALHRGDEESLQITAQAIAVVDHLIHEYPDDAASLEEMRRRLVERLAHFR